MSILDLLGRLALATWLVVLLGGLALLYPPLEVLPVGLRQSASVLSLRNPFSQIDPAKLHTLYDSPKERERAFGVSSYRDAMFDWGKLSPPAWLYPYLERAVQFVEVGLPSLVVPAPMHLLHVIAGPSRAQVLRTVVLFGIPDLLADRVCSLRELHALLTDPAHAVRQEAALRSGMLPNERNELQLPSFARMPLGKLERLMQAALAFGYFTEAGQ